MSDKVSGIEDAAKKVLMRAVELDVARRFDEAVVCYQEGLQLMLDVLKNTSDKVKKEHIRKKIDEYMGRAEQIKLFVQEVKEACKSHDQIQIDENSKGHSYESIFSKFLDSFLTEIEIEDPYIRSTHQVYNLLRFCEMVIKSKAPVKQIKLTTGKDEDAGAQNQQQNRLQQLSRSLQSYDIDLTVAYSDSLHDREIRFNNGWIVKIGRGLDIYKATDSKFSIGFCDFDLRSCHKTTVDIFHTNYVNKRTDSCDDVK